VPLRVVPIWVYSSQNGMGSWPSPQRAQWKSSPPNWSFLHLTVLSPFLLFYNLPFLYS
jgi:hypothetical protein